MVLGALISEVAASPTHAHLHRHAHAKKDVDWNTIDWDNLGIDWVSAWKAGQHTSTVAPVATVAPTTAAPVAAQTTAAAASSAADSSSSSVVETAESDAAELWNGLVGAANYLTSLGGNTPTSGSEVDYVSNVGYPVEGSNMVKVDSVDGYDFTNEFINTSGATMTIVVWNKAASQGLKNPLKAIANLGSCIAPVTPALTFVLKPGASQIVAFAEQSVIGWTQPTSSIAESGQFQNTWGEVKFDPTGSGYDVSAILNPNNNNYVMSITSVEAPDCTSDQNQNMWLTDSDPVGSGSCYIAQSTAHLTTKMGGTS